MRNGVTYGDGVADVYSERRIPYNYLNHPQSERKKALRLRVDLLYQPAIIGKPTTFRSTSITLAESF